MNLYLRYFDRETLVSTVDEAIDFLQAIDEIEMTPMLEADIRDYVASDVFYPKRYKIHPRVYFIIIKTDAATMQDFKEKKAVHTPENMGAKATTPILARLNEIRPGWYEGTIDFKRVTQIPGTGKFQYRDTQFVACVKASSGMECYERIVDHLRERVDDRSQFPAAKGKCFKFIYLGKAKKSELSDMNKVMLIGNVGQDPEVRYVDQGVAVARLRLATTERGYTLQNGTQVPDHTDWHNVILWRRLAEIVEKYVHKGDKLYIEGRIRYTSYDDKQGQRRYQTEIWADNMELLSPKPSTSSVASEPAETPMPDQKQGEQLPF